MSITSSTYVDAFNTVQGELPWQYGFPYPEPFEERLFSAGYNQVQADPYNKVLFMSNKPQTYTKIAPTPTNQLPPMIEPGKKRVVFQQNVKRI